MKPRIKLGAGTLPDGTLLELFEHDGDHEIRIGGLEVMESRKHHSEMELARLGCEGVGAGAKVMIGGLGMGFTLRATLDLLPPDGRAIQVEVVPEIVEWNRGPLARHAGHPLDDPRTELRVDDFTRQVQRHREDLAAIVTDIDNGPSSLLSRTNAWLYSNAGLAALRRALAPGGRLAIWSASEETWFLGNLRARGFEAERHTVHARPGRRGPKYFVFVGRRSD